ncbi:MAG: sulfurtransferase [Pseudomonadota bacterium]
MRLILIVCILLSTHMIGPAFGQHQPLITVEQLKQSLNDDTLVILDIRSPRKSRNFYEEGHIDGAIAAPYNEGWRATVDGVIGMLPAVPEISDHIGGLGISNDSNVVIVPHGNSSTDFSAATRIYWTFKVLGHDAVSILEGGYAAWLAKGGRLSKKSTTLEPKIFKADFREELVSSEQDVQQSLNDATLLVDARPSAQYLGKAKSPVVKRAGTIPEAVNLRQSTLYDPRNTTFLSQSELKALTHDLSISESGKSITFCNTGHWASIAWFALSEIAGQENVSLYDGSMAEWTEKDSNPVQ